MCSMLRKALFNSLLIFLIKNTFLYEKVFVICMMNNSAIMNVGKFKRVSMVYECVNYFECEHLLKHRINSKILGWLTLNGHT